MDFKIPTRPKDDATNPKFKQIENSDKDCMVYAVLFGCPNETAFLRFHPEYYNGKYRLNEVGKRLSQQFFSYARHKEFIDAYIETLADYIGRADEVGTRPKPSKPVRHMSDDEKDAAVKNFAGKVYRALENADAKNLDELKDAADLGKTVKIFKEDEIKVEPARRYLPETCGECRYKRFIDEQVRLGAIVDTDKSK